MAAADQDPAHALEGLKQELAEARAQQAAAREVQRVLRRSAADARPVCDAIAQWTQRLCHGHGSAVFRLDGGLINAVAHSNWTAAALEALGSFYPRPPGKETEVAEAILEGRVIHVPDVDASGVPAPSRTLARALGYRSILVVPILQDGRAAGAIAVVRAEAGAFSAAQIGLLETFADQAAIAIDNARLFEEVHGRTRELQESLKQQAATADVLKTISRSARNLQSVLTALVTSASQLCDAPMVAIHVQRGASLPGRARHGFSPAMAEALAGTDQVLGRGSLAGRTLAGDQPVHIPDVAADAEYTFHEFTRITGARSMLGVPLLRDGKPIGLLSLYRTSVAPFTARQIALMTTFADKAVIAIDNARLVEELRVRTRELARSVQELRALSDVGRAVSSTLDLQVVLKTVVDRAVALSGSDVGSIFYLRREEGVFELGEASGIAHQAVSRLRKLDVNGGATDLAEAVAKRQPLQIADIGEGESNPLRDAAAEAGLASALVVPLLGAERPLGVLLLQRRESGTFSPAVVSLMRSFADQSTIALENARLFEEAAQKSRELEIVGEHKSQFLANMSHELRTPLNAILGYTELMQDGLYGELPAKTMEVLDRVQKNGKHLLGLINDVLDLSKIEAGQVDLNVQEYSMKEVIETVVSATEGLASAKRVPLEVAVADDLPLGRGDERRIAQVLLNLVGNAIKFTDVGKVRIAAGAANGTFSVTVSDTGPGIRRSEQEKIFREFHQVDGSNTKDKGGTGLGLAIARRIVELHGGRIWVRSEVGEGATFQFDLPVKVAQSKGFP